MDDARVRNRFLGLQMAVDTQEVGSTGFLLYFLLGALHFGGWCWLLWSGGSCGKFRHAHQGWLCMALLKHTDQATGHWHNHPPRHSLANRFKLLPFVQSSIPGMAYSSRIVFPLFILAFTRWPLNVASASGLPPDIIDLHQPALYDRTQVESAGYIPMDVSYCNLLMNGVSAPSMPPINRLRVLLQFRSIMASKCFSQLTQSGPQSADPGSHNLAWFNFTIDNGRIVSGKLKGIGAMEWLRQWEMQNWRTITKWWWWEYLVWSGSGLTCCDVRQCGKVDW